jgi:antitoxin component of MazEF toxin-antitoxin module
MALLVERKLFKIGEGGFALTLPKAWINYHHLKPGDKVEIVVDENLFIRVKKNNGAEEKAN